MGSPCASCGRPPPTPVACRGGYCPEGLHDTFPRLSYSLNHRPRKRGELGLRHPKLPRRPPELGGDERDIEVLCGDQPPQAGKHELQKRWEVPQGVLKTNCVRTPRSGLLSSPPVGSRPPVASSRARRRPLLMLLKPCAPDLGLRIQGCPGLGAGAQGFRVFGGYETLMQSLLPLLTPPFGSGREGFSSCVQAAQGPRLASRVRNAGELSGQGRREEKDSKSVRERRGRSQNVPARPALISPLTQSRGSQSRLGTGPASPGGGERALRATFGPNRHAPQIQAEVTGLEHRKERGGDKGRPRGGARGSLRG